MLATGPLHLKRKYITEYACLAFVTESVLAKLRVTK